MLLSFRKLIGAFLFLVLACNYLQASENITLRGEIYSYTRRSADDIHLINITNILNNDRNRITDDEKWSQYINNISPMFCRCHCLANEQTRAIRDIIKKKALEMHVGEHTDFSEAIKAAMKEVEQNLKP